MFSSKLTKGFSRSASQAAPLPLGGVQLNMPATIGRGLDSAKIGEGILDAANALGFCGIGLL
ncbi:MAG: hypothetical protein ACRECN_04870, partial [Methylocella sp.]